MKGILYRPHNAEDCELYCGAEYCPGNCIVKEHIYDDSVLMAGFISKPLSDEEYMERAIRRYSEPSTEDEKSYADWCFQNNWWKGDYETWLYIGGNDDDDYRFWVEKELGLLKECPMQPHLFCAIDDECDYCRVPTWKSSHHDYTPEELETPWDKP